MGIQKLAAIIILSLLSFAARSQPAYFNSEDYWRKLVLDKPATIVKLLKPDTAILIASNRRMLDTGLRFMLPRRDGKQIRYFIVYVTKGKWHVKQIKDLYSGLQMLPDKQRDMVVYTEGMGKLFTSEVERGISMSGQYQVNVLMLDYPSITTNRRTIGNYRFAMRNARVNYRDFVPVLDTLKRIRQGSEFHEAHLALFFHSMGNILLRKLIRRGKLPPLNDEVWVDNLILNAPCVPAERHNKWLEKIHFAKHIYVHFNPEDHTLAGAHLLSKKKQLGEKLHRPLAKNAIYINFSHIAGRGHNNFLSLYDRDSVKQSSFHHYSQLFHGDSVNLSDTRLYIPGSYRGIGWDILP
jgi:hypothetical protein